jgi:NitT/TauT family transport system permease protein
MAQPARLFKTEQPFQRPLSAGDVVVLAALAVLLYVGARLALAAPEVLQGPTISLAPVALPWYAFLSLGRMTAAYVLSILFSLLYGYLAAYNHRAEQVLMPLLDVLQSVPILSFLPVVLLSLSAILPQGIAAELAAIVLIFTSQAWNLTFTWYQSLTTIPKELREATATFRLNAWLRFRNLELPFAAIGLIWNSMMSWAGGWFFLMAAESFTVGQRDFRLPGLGSYLQEAARQGDVRAIAWGLIALVSVVILLDQLVWRPLLAWSERFKLEMVESENPTSSWFYSALRTARLSEWLTQKVWLPLREGLDAWISRRLAAGEEGARARGSRPWGLYGVAFGGGLVLVYGTWRAVQMLGAVPWSGWGAIGLGVTATLLRVTAALVIALAWTLPVGVAIGTNPTLSAWLQPVVQIIASVPATALFPVLLLVLVGLPGGLSLAAVLLMLMGTQWYLLFNVIAGASAIPQDLKFTTSLMRLRAWQRWRTLILPALFPYIITGAITASGGAWNASIVAEHVAFGGQTLSTVGIGALIAQATATGNYPLLLASTLSMVLTVVLINRLVWRPLYRLASERFRME